MTRAIVVDVLAREHGRRIVTVDVIGVGPRAVAGLLESLGVHADVYPFEAVARDPHVLRGYDVLFASAMSSDAPAAKKLAEMWARHGGGGPSVIGGPIASAPLDALNLGYDFVVHGEAEQVLPEALKRILNYEYDDLFEVRGLAFRYRGRVVFTGRPGYAPRERLAYLHSTDVTRYDAYWAARVYVEVVRGCSNWRRPRGVLPDGRACINCDLCVKAPLRSRLYCPAWIPPGCGYCSVPWLYGPARSRPLDLIVEEVKRLVDLGVRRIVLSAPDVLDYGRDLLVDPEPLTDPCNPPANIEALGELFARLYERVPELESREAYLMIENVKACLVDERVAKLLGEYLRGTPVHIGVETGSERHMWLLGRPVTKKDVERAVRLLSRHGLEPYVYFIYGLPWETPETVKETVEFMERLWRLGAVKVTAYRFRPLPGTAFQDFEPPRPGSPGYAIREKAEELNRREKRRWLGKLVDAIVAGWHPARRMLVAYPLPHGPVTLLRGPRSLIGWLVRLRVVGVASDRMLVGRLVSRLKRVAGKRREAKMLV